MRDSDIISPMSTIQVGEEIEVSIDSLTMGDGVGRLDGQVCFVKGALPGEIVKAKVVSAQKRFIRAAVVSVLKPTPYREEPPCPYVPECGGCQYQHLAYAEELRWKEEQARETLWRIGKIQPEHFEPIVASPQVYGYRNSITLTQGSLGDQRAWGFYAEDNVSIIPIERCLIACEELNTFLKAGIHNEKYRNFTSLTLKVDKDGKVADDGEENFFKMRVLGVDFQASSRGFFQVNIPVAEKMIEKIRSWISPLESFELFDVYAGTGLFGILCGEKAKAVYALESHITSVKALRQNYKELRKGFYQILSGPAEKELAELLEKNSKGPRVLILDPPRDGLDKNLAEILAKNPTISHLIYISCEASHLARDLQILCGENPEGLSRYKLASIAPFDMFPQTKHTEVMAFLTVR